MLRLLGNVMSAHSRVLRGPLMRTTALTVLAAVLVSTSGAWAQSTTPSGGSKSGGTDLIKAMANPKEAGQASQRMVLEADTAVYDNDRNLVIAIGRVSVYYSNRHLTSDKLTYYRATQRVVAEGNARLVSEDGTVVTGQSMDVTRDFQTGFVNDLHMETIDRSRFAATTARRENGNVTTFEGGVYSACQTCVLEPQKPPFWQIKAAKIIHNQQERMVYYEDAKLEFFGQSVAWLPWFSHPDPSVSRKTGLLAPTMMVSNKLGVGMRVPYFWAPVPDWDVTFSPAYLSRQGLFADVEVRHRTQNGTWSVRGMGIHQNDPGAFDSKTSNEEWRGAFSTKAKFYINEKWSWGWDATLLSDRRFAADYKVRTPDETEASSSLFLTGLGDRNYFDARVSTFQVYTDDDTKQPNNVGRFLQDKQPVAGTVDYSYIHPDPVMGGEASAKFNLTAIDRSKADLDVAGQLHGAAGDYGRMSAEFAWRRQIIDNLGQVWKPFLSARGDFFFNHNSDPTNVDWISSGTAARFMPTAGIEYRYPFLLSSTLGSSILEPIAQLVVRPNETRIGRLPNEDAQSLVFDDTTLFQADKFSGWDRVEGGVRANLGLQYTFMTEEGASLSLMAGQSIHLAGVNSFADPNQTELLLAEYDNSRPLTGIGSGLDTKQSDYVGRVYLNTGSGFRFGTQARLDNSSWKLNRLDVQGTAVTGPLTSSLTYSFLRTPDIVYTLLQDTSYYGTEIDCADSSLDTYCPSKTREEIQGAMSLRASTNWRFFGSMRYDVRNHFLVGSTFGVGYDNDSFSASLSYIDETDSAAPILADGTRNVSDRTLYFRFGFRTLGSGSVSNSLPTQQ